MHDREAEEELELTPQVVKHQEWTEDVASQLPSPSPSLSPLPYRTVKILNSEVSLVYVHDTVQKRRYEPETECREVGAARRGGAIGRELVATNSPFPWGGLSSVHERF